MAQYSLFVLKVPLNTKQTNSEGLCIWICLYKCHCVTRILSCFW